MLSFQPIALSDKPVIDEYFKPHGFGCAEFTFTNIIMWGQDEKIRWAQENDVLYVLLRFGKHPPFMFPPIPKNFDMPYMRAVDTAVRYFHEAGDEPRFRSVNGRFIPLFLEQCPQFTLTPDRNTFDYVYAAQDLITLGGRKYHSKRNHIHQFTSQYAFEYRPLDASMADECMALYKSWLMDKDVHEPGILGEMRAIQFLLPNLDALDAVGGSIYVDGKLVAFTIGEQIREDTALIHIEKADSSFTGLYALINREFASHTFSHVTYINREDDMGVPGMRKAKLSYHPTHLIEKCDAVIRP